MRRAIATLSLLLAVGGSGDAMAAAQKPKGKRVTLQKSDYGRIIADGRGRTLYLFTRDDGKSRCYGDCADAWPPLITKGAPRAGDRVKKRLLGTVKRRDGHRQVTYNGHPLYYYVGDSAPGEVLCQAVFEFGGWWYVVRRSGEAVK